MYDQQVSLVMLGPVMQEMSAGYLMLCEKHARSFTAPVGWNLIKHADIDKLLASARSEDLNAVLNAVQKKRVLDRPGSAGPLQQVDADHSQLGLDEDEDIATIPVRGRETHDIKGELRNDSPQFRVGKPQFRIVK